MMNFRFIYAAVLAAMPLSALAQDFSTEITVNHEVVPEEQAATRLRLFPKISLPSVSAGRLPAASHFVPSELTPFISPLNAAAWLDTLRVSPFRGYAALGYGPVYNLNASAGYRFVNTSSLTVDAYMQFNGMSYTSDYFALPKDYDGRVCFRRNTALAGGSTSWISSHGKLDGSILYQYSGYNFPILDLGSLTTEHNTIDANVVKANVGWGATEGAVDYRVALDYGMLYYGRNLANNNRVALSASLDWHASRKSSWGIDAGYSLDHSSLAGNKGIVHLLPRYDFKSRNFTARLGVDVDIKTGNCSFKPALLVAPEVSLMWMPSPYFNVWGKVTGRMIDNSRIALLDEQPYLLPDFDGSMSRLYSAEAGLTLGPLRGASLTVFAGHMTAKDWYMPAVATGYMEAMNVRGFHGGVSFAYDYRRLLSVNARAEIAESPRGNYNRGYALWRDHAKFNLTASVTVRPISGLDIQLAYHLRTARQKQLAVGDLDLQNINNLKASVNYMITRRWSVSLSGENLLNRNWYMGPSVPNQGIVGMIGAEYKF